MLKKLSDQDYYQVLEVDYYASPEEIQLAYERAREIFGSDSLVSSLILDQEERRQILSRITQAYHTLIAGESRRLYDQALGERTPGIPNAGDPSTEGDGEALGGVASSSPPAYPRLVKGSQRLEEGSRRSKLQLGLKEEASGDFLRRARESTGLDLRSIAEETKIGVTMLRYIEEERLSQLPAPVYLRNFVSQYARCLGLDEKRVAHSYLNRVRRLRAGRDGF